MAKSELHYHGCVQCKRRFGDTCGEAKTFAGPCLFCRTGHEPPIWVKSMEPQPCCFERATPASKHDLKTYRLAGKGPWWSCRNCYRQFPINPKDYA